MRLFVSEYLTSGACPDESTDSSLLREGLSMCRAVLSDFSRIDNCRVVTTWDSRLEPVEIAGVEVIEISSPAAERRQFERLAGACDATFVIAPEFNGILSGRRQVVDDVGGRSLGCSPEAIDLCADKLCLADVLQRAGLQTIDTFRFQPNEIGHSVKYPCVVKPRDGAGSQETYLIVGDDELRSVIVRIGGGFSCERMIVQPYLSGNPVSVAALVSEEGQRIEVFPIAEQKLSCDGRFEYRGGRVPARQFEFASVDQLVRKTCSLIPGLNGYIGFDLILPDGENSRPTIVEINPRLTTSYLGYRGLTNENLAERMLFPGRTSERIDWKSISLVYLPDGTVMLERDRSGVVEDDHPIESVHSVMLKD